MERESAATGRVWPDPRALPKASHPPLLPLVDSAWTHLAEAALSVGRVLCGNVPEGESY